jgi:hypothetical protein
MKGNVTCGSTLVSELGYRLGMLSSWAWIVGRVGWQGFWLWLSDGVTWRSLVCRLLVTFFIDSWSSQMQNGRPTSNHHQGGPVLQQSLEIRSQCSKRNKLSNSYSSSMCPTPQETRTCLSPPTTILGFCCFLTTKCGLTVGSGSGHICNLMTCRLFQVPHCCYLVVLIPNGEVS